MVTIFIVAVISFIICGLANEKYWPLWIERLSIVSFFSSVVVFIISGVAVL